MATTWIKMDQADEATGVVHDRIGDTGHLRFEFSAQGQEGVVELMQRDARSGVVSINGKVLPYRVAHRLDRVEVWIAGRRYKGQVVVKTAKRAGAASETAMTGDILAAMPGTVLSILVNEGQTFEPHQPLIIMESMKMEMTLSSPSAGIVGEIHCEVGELVEMGALLVSVVAGESP